MDFNEMLRKAMEAEQNVEESEKETHDESIDEDDIFSDAPDSAKKLFSIMGSKSMIELSKNARDRISQTILDLIEDLNKLKNLEKPTFNARACAKINAASKKLNVLNILLSTGVLSSMGSFSGTDIDKTIGTIIDINTSRL
ncbi:MAG: hypothetical protein LIR46_12825 [Bacteroidota bacterium]|nr:hypothetical protein [Bacteroidota bacterium]